MIVLARAILPPQSRRVSTGRCVCSRPTFRTEYSLPVVFRHLYRSGPLDSKSSRSTMTSWIVPSRSACDSTMWFPVSWIPSSSRTWAPMRFSAQLSTAMNSRATPSAPASFRTSAITPVCIFSLFRFFVFRAFFSVISSVPTYVQIKNVGLCKKFTVKSDHSIRPYTPHSQKTSNFEAILWKKSLKMDEI